MRAKHGSFVYRFEDSALSRRSDHGGPWCPVRLPYELLKQRGDDREEEERRLAGHHDLSQPIVLAGYDRLPSAAVSFSRRNVFKRDHWSCQYCGCQPGGEELTIDHVIPRSHCGTSTWENCVLACIACNKRKADRTPREAGMRLRKAPVRPTWKPIYARSAVRIESWSKFISETYWNVPLEK